MIHVTINSQDIEVPEGTTVLQAAEKLGITIPTLCYHKDLSPFGGCRLCVVEVQGARLPMTSCNLPVSPEMVVKTETPAILRERKAVLRMLLTNYYDAGYKRNNGKPDIDQESEFAYWARVYDVDIRSAMAKKPQEPVDSDPNPFVWVDMNKCIQCTRCVRACAEVQGRFVWAQAYRGYQARIVAGADSTMLASRCESCGACVVYCPTGALDNKMSVSAGLPDRLVRTTCTYCGVGCQLDLNVKNDTPGGRVIRVTSSDSADHPSLNGLHLCVKGRYGYEFIHSEKRATRPRVRQYLLDENRGSLISRNSSRWVEVDWDVALDVAARGLRHTSNQYGNESVGVLASGRLLNEENYLLNKLARQTLQSNQIDCCANIYNRSVVEGLHETVGLTAMNGTFDEITDHAQSLFVVGSNLSEQHPVFGARIRQMILRRKVKMVVASPDFINIAEYASLELNHQPNTETALVNGLIHLILENGWQNQESIDAHPADFAEFKQVIERYTPAYTSQITGVKEQTLLKAARILAHHRPLAILWSVGLANLRIGRSAIQSLVNLRLVLGDLDAPGGGLTPLRTQNNLQGACDLGALPWALPGYAPVRDEAQRRRFEQAWGTPIPPKPGLSADKMIAAANDGQIKALYIVGEEIINTSTQAAITRRALEQCEFVVVQEMQRSETSRYADVLLPGVSFAEKTGTFTSAERRIQMAHQAIQPLGQSRPDWQIIAELGKRLQANAHQSGAPAPYASWDYADSAQIMQEIASLTPIYGGVSHARLDRGERLHWPVLSMDHAGTLHTPAGLFNEVKFVPVEQDEVEEEETTAIFFST